MFQLADAYTYAIHAEVAINSALEMDENDLQKDLIGFLDSFDVNDLCKQNKIDRFTRERSRTKNFLPG